MSTLRILDAAANRAREALRVVEDAVRFCWDDQPLTAALKTLRHDLAAALSTLPMNHALAERDTVGDVGTTVKTTAEFDRPALKDVVIANAKRLTEALRSLEEFAKLHDPSAAATLEKLRYRAYTLEQSLVSAAIAASAMDRFRHVRLYVLMTASLCTRPWESVLDEILAAAGPAPAGSPRLAVQLREKDMEAGELLRRAKVLVKKCHEAGALAIMNDRPDVALLSAADGVHVGQTDLPPADCRRLLGPEAIIGISTENLDQARAGVAAGATYIAVGPIFPTTTKEKPRLAGPGYAASASREIPRPLVAIGGISLANIGQITAAGVGCVAVSSAILKAQSPGGAVTDFLAALAGTGR